MIRSSIHFETPGVRFHALRTRRSTWPRPPLLALHGFTGCAAQWNPLAAALGDEREVIAIDLPGHGRTLATPAAFPFEAQAEAVARLCEQLGEVHLLGYSMGGRIALGAALRLTGNTGLRSLTLVGAHPGLPAETAREERRRDDECWAKILQDEGLESFADRWAARPLFSTRRNLPTDLQQQLLDAVRNQNPASLAAALRGAGLGMQGDLRPQLRHLCTPMLAVAGELDAKFRGLAEEMAKAAPLANTSIVPGAGHSPQWENFPCFLEVLRSFLRTCDGDARPQLPAACDRRL